MPGAVARTSTFALNNMTLPFVLALADKGLRRALDEDPHLRAGLNVHEGLVTYRAVADALGLKYTPPRAVTRTWRNCVRWQNRLRPPSRWHGARAILPTRHESRRRAFAHPTRTEIHAAPGCNRLDFQSGGREQGLPKSMRSAMDAIVDQPPDGTTGTRPALFLDSSLREKLIEHVFIGDLLRCLWKRRALDVEVLRTEVDRGGYDLVLECNRVLRHVQFKSSHRGAKTSEVSVNLKLAGKPSGCVIWVLFDQDTLELGPFLWFGGAPGAPLPPVRRQDRPPHQGRCVRPKGRTPEPAGGCTAAVRFARDDGRCRHRALRSVRGRRTVVDDQPDSPFGRMLISSSRPCRRACPPWPRAARCRTKSRIHPS